MDQSSKPLPRYSRTAVLAINCAALVAALAIMISAYFRRPAPPERHWSTESQVQMQGRGLLPCGHPLTREWRTRGVRYGVCPRGERFTYVAGLWLPELPPKTRSGAGR